MIDGIQQASPAIGGRPPAKKPTFAPGQESGAEKKDGSALSPEATKKEPTGERLDLLKALKSNYGGNGRIQTTESRLNALSDDQLKSVKKKREFDEALTKHEDDHHRVAADLARSQPLYETEVGEDGQEYRKSGKVMIDTGVEQDDAATVKKMRQVRAAALAPDGNQLAPLSDQDKVVARDAEDKEKAAQLRLDGKGSGTPGKDDKGPGPSSF